MRRSRFTAPAGGLFACMCALFASNVATADTLVVPDEYPTIQAAIDAAVTGDEVVLQPGIYNETFNYNGKGLVVRSAEGPLVTRIDRNGAGGVVVTADGTPAGTSLEGIGIYDGANPVITCVDGHLVMDKVRCVNASGSPFSFVNATIEIRDFQAISCGNRSIIQGSDVRIDGAAFRFGSCGISSSSSSLSLHFVDFESLGGGTGASLTVSGGDALVEDANFLNNPTTAESGGFISVGGASLTLSRVVLDGARVVATGSGSGFARGGGISASNSNVVIRGSVIRNCEAYKETYNGGKAAGGAIYATSSTVSILDSEVSSCRVGSFQPNVERIGAAIFVESQSLLIIDNGVVDSCGPVGSYSVDSPIRMIQSGMSIVDGVIRSCSGNAFVADALTSFACEGLVLSSVGGPSLGSVASSYRGPIVIGGVRSVGSSFNLSNLPSVVSIVVENSTFQSGGGTSAALSLPEHAGMIQLNDCVFIGYQSSQALFLRNNEPLINQCAFIDCGNAVGDVPAIRIVDGAAFPLVAQCVFCGPRESQIAGPWIDKGGNVFDADCAADCDDDGLPDDYEVQSGLDADCNGNGLPDSCESGGDCDDDGILDSCAIAEGSSDCNMNGQPDECEADCDGDGLIDVCAISGGDADCNMDGVPDSCQLASGELADANNDGTPDACQVLDFTGLETEIVLIEDRILDSTVPSTAVCYRVFATFSDMQATLTGVFGDAEHPLFMASGGGFWQDGIGGDTTGSVPCDESGMFPDLRYDSWLTIGATCASDNMVLDEGIDFTDFNAGGSLAVDDGIVFITPGQPQGDAGKIGRVLLAQLTSVDGSLPTGTINLLGNNADGSDWLAYDIAWPEPPLVDCNGNGVHDAYDLSNGSSRDCDGSGLPDECEYDTFVDCNNNGIPDLCDVADGTSGDADGDFVPDECECLGDTNRDGLVNVYDIIEIILHWGETGDLDADVSEDGVVDGLDLSLVLQGYGGCL